MPYKSDAQRKYFNANRKELEAQGVDVDEWNESSKGKKLPKKVKPKELGKKAANRCWNGYEPVPGKEPYSDGSCRKKTNKGMKMNTQSKTAQLGRALAVKQAEGGLQGAINPALLGALIGGSAGTMGGGLAGLARGKPVTGLGRGALGGSLVGLGAGAGAYGGSQLGASLYKDNPLIGSLVGGGLGAGAGGLGGYGVGQAIMGTPTSRADDVAAKREKQRQAQDDEMRQLLMAMLQNQPMKQAGSCGGGMKKKKTKKAELQKAAHNSFQRYLVRLAAKFPGASHQKQAGINKLTKLAEAFDRTKSLPAALKAVNPQMSDAQIQKVAKATVKGFAEYLKKRAMGASAAGDPMASPKMAPSSSKTIPYQAGMKF